jgi:GAF domain-containing protein
MLTRIRQFLAPPVFEGDEDKTRTARMLNVLLWASLAIVLTSLLTLLVTPYILATLLSVGSFALPILSSQVLMRRGRVQLAGGLYSFILLVLATAFPILSGGVNSSMVTEFLVVVCVAGLLLRGRVTFILVGLVIAISTGLALAQIKGLLPPPLLDFTNPLLAIVPLVSNTIVIAAMLYLATSSLDEALGRARRYGAESKAQSNQLEKLVQARTQDLARRANYLGATTAVAQESASVLGDPQQLLSRVVDVISQQFGFYHTGLFLVDPAGEWAELSAASSEGGRRMLARGHRLRVGVGGAGQGIVGYVAARGEPRIALDTGVDAVFFDNPDLPDTRSEAALPLRVREEIIGVLDVQSTEPGAFSGEDMRVLQSLADQAAVAISNARLLQQVQESTEAERRSYGELTVQAWQELLRAQSDLGFFSTAQATVPAGDLWRPEMKTALRRGETTVGDKGERLGAATATTLAIPIKVRDRVIGVIDGRKRDGSGQWTQEEIALMQTLTEQLGVALESARLYQDTQRRAARERAIREISDQMQRATDLESLMRITAEELKQTLGGSHTYVHLGTESRLPDGNGQAGEGGN